MSPQLCYFSFTSKHIIAHYQMTGFYLMKHALAHSNCWRNYREVYKNKNKTLTFYIILYSVQN